jgi:hypothetical protein
MRRHTRLAFAPFLLALAGAPCATATTVTIIAPADQQSYRPVYSERRIRDIVAPVLEGGCDPAAVAARLEPRYRFLGYVPSIETICGAEGASITIRDSSHVIALVTFDPAELTRIGVTASDLVEERVRLYPVAPDAPRAALRGLLKTKPGDLYNFERYRSDRDALLRAGYAVAFIPGAPLDGPFPAGAYLIQGLAPPATAGARDQRETNYLGGTASYGPQRGGAVGAIYQKDEVFGALDRLNLSATWNSAIGADIVYRSPFLASRDDPRNLYDFEVRGFSSYLNNRVLAGVTTDERDSGGAVAFGLRPLRVPAPHDLRLQFGVRYQRTDLSDPVPGTPDETLTLLQIGADYAWRHSWRHPSLSLHVAPLLEHAIASSGGSSDFIRLGVDATLHGRLRSGVEFDLRSLDGTIDRDAPSFELWSLGGSNTVRGFRDDAFLGRDMASLQSELWLPFARPTLAWTPGGPDELPPPRPRLLQALKAAVFIDGGLVSGTLDGRSPAIAGAGVGLRFAIPRNPLVIRLDYGWGLGPYGGDSFPYVSLRYAF